MAMPGAFREARLVIHLRYRRIGMKVSLCQKFQTLYNYRNGVQRGAEDLAGASVQLAEGATDQHSGKATPSDPQSLQYCQ